MKHLILSILVLSSFSVLGQKPGKFPFREVMVSMNYTTPYASNRVTGNLGYGIGVRGYFGQKENQKRVFSVEYNQTNINVADYQSHHFVSNLDMRTTIHCLTWSFNHLQKLGETKKSFFELGVYADGNLKSVERGYQETFNGTTGYSSEGDYKKDIKLRTWFIGVAGAVGREINQFKLRLEYKYSFTETDARGYYDFANRYARFCVAYYIK